MLLEKIYENLCTYDVRSPYYFDWDDKDYNSPRVNCSCDNCFYGRDELAQEIIRLRSRSDGCDESRSDGCDESRSDGCEQERKYHVYEN